MNKAVIFTHVPITEAEAAASNNPIGEKKIIDKVLPYFKAYIKCKNVGLVYVYVDVGTRMILKKLSYLNYNKNVIKFPLMQLESEVRTRNCLKIAVDRAVNSNHNMLDGTPRFVIIGLPHLLSLFNSLININPKLIQHLAGSRGDLTYDSPKFVEAVIRLVRGQHADLNRNPIFRFDLDVKVNEKGINELLKSAFKAMRDVQQLVHFFSGKYQTYKKRRDDVNDFAVRTHWLVDPKTMRLSPLGYQFMRDLGEIGATQLPTTDDHPVSSFMSAYMKKNHLVSANRDSLQVISGAGLFMTYAAIQQLPPFMDFDKATMWVDDHLKRRLHEATGRLDAASIEQNRNACFKQNRHPLPKGITNQDIEWAKNDYLFRLFRGCLVHSLIMKTDGTPGLMADAIRTIITNGLNTVHQLNLLTHGNLQKDLRSELKKTAIKVKTIWGSASYGSSLLSGWASALTLVKINKICSETLQDVMAYVELVCKWRSYVRAIELLEPRNAHWLFKKVK